MTGSLKVDLTIAALGALSVMAVLDGMGVFPMPVLPLAMAFIGLG